MTFDIYGTLVDWEPSIVAFLQDWAERQRLSPSEQDLLMAFDRASAEIQKARPCIFIPTCCAGSIVCEYAM